MHPRRGTPVGDPPGGLLWGMPQGDPPRRNPPRGSPRGDVPPRESPMGIPHGDAPRGGWGWLGPAASPYQEGGPRVPKGSPAIPGVPQGSPGSPGFPGFPRGSPGSRQFKSDTSPTNFHENLILNKKTGSVRMAIYMDKKIVNTSQRKDFILKKFICLSFKIIFSHFLIMLKTNHLHYYNSRFSGKVNPLCN